MNELGDTSGQEIGVAFAGALLSGAATGYATRKAGFLLAVPAALAVAVVGFWVSAFLWEKATGRL